MYPLAKSDDVDLLLLLTEFGDPDLLLYAAALIVAFIILLLGRSIVEFSPGVGAAARDRARSASICSCRGASWLFELKEDDMFVTPAIGVGLRVLLLDPERDAEMGRPGTWRRVARAGRLLVADW